MFIDVKGGKKQVRQQVSQAAFFYAETLIAYNVLDKLILNITLRKINDGNVGYCDLVDLDDECKEISIEIDYRQPADEILITLAHEMVHVKQYIEGSLNPEIINGCVRWKEENISMSRDKDDYPWEIEANDREQELYNRYKNEKDKG